MANFLTFGKSFCFHEPIVGMNSIHELRPLFESTGREIVGSSDCGNLYLAKSIRYEFPDSLFVTIHRPLDECRKQLKSIGLPDNGTLEDAYTKLRRVRNDYGALSLNADDLSDPESAKELCAYIGVDWDRQRYNMLNSLNIQPMPDWLGSKMTTGNARSVLNLLRAK